MNSFEIFMRKQYQWDEQFDMEEQYSQLDMQAAYNAGLDRTAEIANKYLEEVDNSSAFNRGKIRTVNDIQEKIRREKTTE